MRPRFVASLARRSSSGDMDGLLGLLDHAVLDGADTLDLDPDDVAGGKEGRGLPGAADAARGAGRDDVARLEREGRGQVLDLREAVVDQLARVRVLAVLAVDRGLDLVRV